MKFTTLMGAVSLAALGTAVAAQDADLLVFDYSGFEEPQHHTVYNALHGDDPTFAFFGDELVPASISFHVRHSKDFRGTRSTEFESRANCEGELRCNAKSVFRSLPLNRIDSLSRGLQCLREACD